ncbi:MAG TPA: hypothetical protein VK689_07055 [Armatimonadota bacterium]|nr:hypothetical protein [Armatimonadota bacterium]
MIESIPAVDPQIELSECLAHLRSMIENGDVEGGRAYIKELEARWPDSDDVKYWARVLAPPKVIGYRPATGYSLEREKDWLTAHAREYPGCWLALDGPRLIAASPDLQSVREAAKLDGATDPLFHFQPGARR